MIESHLDKESNATKINAPLPTSSSAFSDKSSMLSVSQPVDKNKHKNKSLYILLIVFLFAFAVLGGYFAYQTINKSSKLDVTKTEDTQAWRPVSVTGTCTGGRVIGNNEQVPYSFNFTFILANGDRSSTLQNTFNSSIVGSANKIDSDFTWTSLGDNGDSFGKLLRTNDRITWKVAVNYVTNGQTQTENHEGFFNIFDTSCGQTATSAPSPSTVVSMSPSPTRTAVPSPTQTASPTSTAVATATPTTVPAQSPPVGGAPSPTATPTPTATPVPSQTAAPTNPPQAASTPGPSNPPTSVASEQSQSLPKAGVENNSIALILIGAISLLVSAGFAFNKKKLI